MKLAGLHKVVNTEQSLQSSSKKSSIKEKTFNKAPANRNFNPTSASTVSATKDLREIITQRGTKGVKLEGNVKKEGQKLKQTPSEEESVNRKRKQRVIKNLKNEIYRQVQRIHSNSSYSSTEDEKTSSSEDKK